MESKINQLTGLRFIAALLVFFSHEKNEFSNSIFFHFFESGYIGVSFFFILSGFVMSFTYKAKIQGKQITFLHFFYFRLVRITPLHWLTTIPLAIYFIISNKISPLTAMANLFYLQSWFPDRNIYFSLNSPSWSLSNEVFFYFLFYFFVYLSTKVLAFILGLLVISLISLNILISNFDTAINVHWIFYIFPVSRLVEFLIGILIHQAWLTKQWKLGNLHGAFSYILIAGAMICANAVSEGLKYSLFFIPFLIYFFICNLDARIFTSKILSSKIMILFGESSFAFYLLHGLVINYFDLIPSNFFSALKVISELLLTLLISITIHKFFENWAIKKLRDVIY